MIAHADTRAPQDSQGGATVAGRSANHPVHADIARIADAFADATSPDDSVPTIESVVAEDDPLLPDLAASIEPTTPAEACLVPTLAAIGWAGSVREVKEVLPHFDRVRNVEALRGVLARLNYKTECKPINFPDIRDAMMPCLFSTDGDDVWLIVERGAGGEFLLFDGASANWRLLDPVDIKGFAYPIVAGATQQLLPESGPWLPNVIRRFKPLILRIFILSLIINLAALALPLFVMHVYDLGIAARAKEVVLCLVLGALIVVVALAGHKTQPPWWDGAADIREMAGTTADGTGNEGTDEYVPAGADPYEVNKEAPRVVLCGAGARDCVCGTSANRHECAPAPAQILSWGADEKHFRLHAPLPQNLVLRLFNYPAWEATVNGNPVPTETTDLTGQIVIPIPAGDNDLRLRFRRTPDRTLGGAVSLLSSAFFFALWWKTKVEPQSASLSFPL